jgi:hypothetical protein
MSTSLHVRQADRALPPARDLKVEFDLAAAFTEAFGEHLLAGHCGLLAATRDMLEDPAWRPVDLAEGKPIDAAALTRLPNPLLARQGYVVCRYASPDAGSVVGADVEGDRADALRAALLEQERLAIGAAVHGCHEFLAGRRTGGQRLSAHPAVAARLGELVAEAAVLQRADAATALATAAGRRWLLAQVDAIALGLIALAGGRALLADGAVQLRTVLLTINRIYLAGQTCSN